MSYISSLIKYLKLGWLRVSVCSVAILCILATTCEPQSVGVFPSDHRAPQKDQQCFAVEEPKLIGKYMASNSVSLTQVVCCSQKCITPRTYKLSH